jgi:F-type H+-transporting ATPase subunit gamma
MRQTTRALEMVAASKMRRAQERVTQSRPYSDRLREVLGDLASIQLDSEELKQFPLLDAREVKKTALIVITPDRGLAGALNSNIIRRTVETIAVGKKGRDFLVRTRQELVAEFIRLGDRPTLDEIRPIAEVAINDYLEGKVDSVQIVYPKFINTLTQQATVVQLLPVERPETENKTSDYIFEPDAATVLNAILPRYIEVVLYQAVLETVASFYSAQMVAMRNASDNAKELVDDLSLTLNKVRQAQITNEVAEISAGANAFRTE